LGFSSSFGLILASILLKLWMIQKLWLNFIRINCRFQLQLFSLFLLSFEATRLSDSQTWILLPMKNLFYICIGALMTACTVKLGEKDAGISGEP
jgi:hypothetical protein